jgi:hypothetical protein
MTEPGVDAVMAGKATTAVVVVVVAATAAPAMVSVGGPPVGRGG